MSRLSCFVLVFGIFSGETLQAQSAHLRDYRFVRATYEIPTTLNPVDALSEAQAALTTQIFDGLLRVTQQLQLEPNLAESWQVQNDGTRYVFNIRKDIRFHDGVRLEPRHVVASLERLLEARTQVKTSLSQIRNVYIDAGNRVVIDLITPFPALLAVLASAPAHVARFRPDGSFVGTGPFQFGSRQNDTRLELRRNDAYHLQVPFFVSAVYERLDEAEAIKKLQLGEVHDASLFQSLLLPTNTGHAVAQVAPSAATWLLAINVRDGILRELPARRCLFDILPKSDIMSRLLPHHAPAGGYLAPGLPGHDPDLALQGVGTSSLCEPYRSKSLRMQFPSYLPVTGEICQEMQTAARRSGIELICEPVDFTEMLRKMELGQYDICLLAITLDIPVSEYLFWTFEQGADWKIANVASSRLSAWLSMARRSGSEQERAAIYKQMNRFIYENVLTINLSYPGHTSARHNCLRDYSLDIAGPSYLSLAHLTLAADCRNLDDFRPRS